MDADRSELDCLRAAIEASGDAAYDWDVRTGAISWLGDAEGILGVKRLVEVAQAERYLGRVSPSCIAELRRAHTDQAQTGNRFACTYQLRRGDNRYTWIEDRGRFELSENGEPTRIVGTLRCIDEQKRDNHRLARLANFDDLTGQYNRGRLREALEHSVAYAVRYKSRGVYLQIGIDNLSLILDTYGREVADQVILAASRELDRNLRASDVIGRIANDQFGVVLNGCSGGDISTTVEKILLAVEQASVVTDKGYLPVTASVGAVSFPDSVRTAHEAMAKSDVALEKARRSGHNCFNLYDMSEEQLGALRDNLAVAELVQRALRDKRFSLYFQPVVEAGSGQPAFYECLLRMFDDDNRAIPAGEFLPIAEKMGLVRSIDRFVLELVLEELRQSPDVHLALNISSLSTTDPSWLRTLIANVQRQPDLARRLVVEITETTALQDIKETIRFVAALREMGCRVALDDFGAGYTSFRHLQELAIDIVKIDGSFVKTIAERPNSRLFVTTLQSFADGLGLMTVAECVETADIARILVEHNIGYLQGYHFGRPSPERLWLAPPAAAQPASGDAAREPCSPKRGVSERPTARH